MKMPESLVSVQLAIPVPSPYCLYAALHSLRKRSQASNHVVKILFRVLLYNSLNAGLRGIVGLANQILDSFVLVLQRETLVLSLQYAGTRLMVILLCESRTAIIRDTSRKFSGYDLTVSSSSYCPILSSTHPPSHITSSHAYSSW
jgi:hypothetical protein